MCCIVAGVDKYFLEGTVRTNPEGGLFIWITLSEGIDTREIQLEAKTRKDVIPYGKKLQEKGARNVLISMAGAGAVLVAEDGQVFEEPAPKGRLVNGVGAGDSMVAGFVAGWMEKKDYEHAFHMGIAAGSASAFSENLATKEEIEAVYRQITEK